MFNLKGEMNSKEEILNKPQEGAQVSHWATTETTDGSRVSWNILFFKSFFCKGRANLGCCFIFSFTGLLMREITLQLNQFFFLKQKSK